MQITWIPTTDDPEASFNSKFTSKRCIYPHTHIYRYTVETLSLALLPSPLPLILPWTFPRLQEVKKRWSRDISSLKKQVLPDENTKKRAAQKGATFLSFKRDC